MRGARQNAYAHTQYRDTYTYAARLKPKGWTLLTYQHLRQYREVFTAHYLANGGLRMMGTWASSGCCLTVAGGYRLTARKGFASVAATAKYLMVWCAVEGDTPYAHRMLFAVVDVDWDGVELLDDWQMLGMRSTISCGVRFTDVFVPDDHVVGTPGGWVTGDPRTFSCGYAANHLGSAQAAFDFLAEYIAERPDLRDSESVRVKLGQMADLVYGAMINFLR